MLPGSLASKALQMVTWRYCELTELPHPVDLVELPANHRPEALWTGSAGRCDKGYR